MFKPLTAAAASFLFLSACAGVQEDANAQSAAKPAATAAPKAAVAASVNRYFEVHTETRIYVFTEPSIYEAYKTSGELAYTRAKIGEGPGGKTLVFGITKDDAANPLDVPSPPERAFADLAATLGSDDFFGLIERDNRYYVSTSVKEFLGFHSTGEAAYARTSIGGGLGGKTLVYVHTKEEVGKPLTRDEELYKQIAR